MKKRKTVAVIGLGVFGVELVKHLKDLKADVVAIDKDPNRVLLTGELADRSFICDSGNMSALEEIGIDKVDYAIVALSQGNPNSAVATITTTLALKKLGIKEIVVRLDDESYREVLTEIGATYLFSPLKMASERLANVVLGDNYEDYFNISDDYSVVQIEVSEDFKETSLMDLNAPSKYGVIIVLMKRDGKVFMPKSDDTIRAHDEVFAFGTKEDSDRFARDLVE